MAKGWLNNSSFDSATAKLQAAILLMALCLYLAIWYLMSFDESAYLQIDSADYRLLGKSIFTNFSFPSSFRTPVFPAFQGFWEALLSFSISQYIVIQILLALINIYLLGRLVSFFAGVAWQLIAMLVFSVDLLTMQVANYVLSETLFSFLLLLSLNMLLTIHASAKNRYGLAIICGVCFGLFALCRPVGQYIPFALVPWIILFRRDEHDYKSRWIVSALVVVVSLSLVHAWKLNNLVNKGHYFTSITTSFNMYNYRAAWNVAYRDGRPFDDVKVEFDKKRNEFIRENSHMSSYEIGQHFTREGLSIILLTPKETFFQAVRGFVFLYGGIYNSSLDRIFNNDIALKAAQAYSLLYNMMLYLGVLLSFYYWKVFDAQKRSLFVLCGLVVFYFTFFSIGVESYARLRAPIMPYLVCVSIVGWVTWLRSVRFLKH